MVLFALVYALCTLTCLCSIIKQLGQKEKATLFLSNNTTTLGNHFDLLISRGSKYSFNSLKTCCKAPSNGLPEITGYVFSKSSSFFFTNQAKLVNFGRSDKRHYDQGLGLVYNQCLWTYPRQIYDKVDKSFTILCDTFGDVFFNLFQPGAALMAFYSGGSDQPPPLRHLHQDEPTLHNCNTFLKSTFIVVSVLGMSIS